MSYIRRSIFSRNHVHVMMRRLFATESNKTNLLLYEKQKKKPKKNCGYKVPPIQSLNAKQIKVCTGVEMKRKCAPKLVHVEHTERGSLLKWMMLFALKSVIAGVATYVTWEAGVWGDQESTERIFKTVCGACVKDEPSSKKKIFSDSDVCQAEIALMPREPNRPAREKCVAPDRTREINKFRLYWNSMINSLFHNVVAMPAYLLMLATGPDCKDEKDTAKKAKKK